MADAITYADLRFVKVPLKNSVSNHLGQDCEAYEDGELTYENVQVSQVPGRPPGLASPALVDKAGVGSEQPTTSWSSVKSSALRQIPSCPTVCLQYFLLGLLLACLMLGVAVICLGVHYLQVSQQFQEVTRIWEATNGSLQQQLREKISQLGQKEAELEESQRKLTSSQDTLKEKQKTHEGTEQQLQACQDEREKTKEKLKSEEQQRRDLNQRLMSMQDRLKSMRDTLRRSSSCSSDTCCPCGWIQQQKRCFYVSHALRSLEESQKYCESLSSKLAALTEPFKYQLSLPSRLKELLDGSSPDGSKSYWTQQTSHIEDNPQNGKKRRSESSQNSCELIKNYYKSWWKKNDSKCTERHPCICEMEAFRFPEEIHLN
ncbi:B-cell differentiation antigen CD72 isoform X2 [Arvicanthis niloticus]|uniref:B-cell differentiation antigen CD72 isoform X2 n=1 Tax=Arvicanthis niloticus TaxID=61156 RepID=UPI00148681A1|nr:B-cell differentiation antigen CD72 [Arvicanthis niloticus]